MGNTRFRLAHVMPNVWFYKLRDIGRTRSQRKLLETRKTRVPESAIALPRRSYYFVKGVMLYRKASVVTPFPEQANMFFSMVLIMWPDCPAQYETRMIKT